MKIKRFNTAVVSSFIVLLGIVGILSGAKPVDDLDYKGHIDASDFVSTITTTMFETATATPTTDTTTKKTTTSTTETDETTMLETSNIYTDEYYDDITTSSETSYTFTTCYDETNIVDETTCYEEPETQVTEEYVVFKESTHYIHKNTCRWVDSGCYLITTTADIECRSCTECGPEMEVINIYNSTPVNEYNGEYIDGVYQYEPGEISLNYITEAERVMLCNLVGGEYGSDWVDEYEKGKVIATVMNRIRTGGWTNGLPDTIYNVLAAPYQYSMAYTHTQYNANVTKKCINAVEYYFDHQDEYPSNIYSFYGDGMYNHFR